MNGSGRGELLEKGGRRGFGSSSATTRVDQSPVEGLLSRTRSPSIAISALGIADHGPE